MCAVWTTATRRTPHSQEAGERQEAYKDVNIARCCTVTCSRAILFAAVADHRGLALAAAFPVTASRPPGQGVPAMQSRSMPRPAHRARLRSATAQWPQPPRSGRKCRTAPIHARPAVALSRRGRPAAQRARRGACALWRDPIELMLPPGGASAVDCAKPPVRARVARAPLSQTTPVA